MFARSKATQTRWGFHGGGSNTVGLWYSSLQAVNHVCNDRIRKPFSSQQALKIGQGNQRLVQKKMQINTVMMMMPFMSYTTRQEKSLSKEGACVDNLNCSSGQQSGSWRTIPVRPEARECQHEVSVWDPCLCCTQGQQGMLAMHTGTAAFLRSVVRRRCRR